MRGLFLIIVLFSATQSQALPPEDAALAARDAGRHAEALARWTEAAAREGADGFVWSQLGWARAAMGQAKPAREAFAKAVERSGSVASQAEAQFGLGLTALLDGDARGAMVPFRSALIQGSYVIPVAAHQTALTALALGDKKAAFAYLRQCATLDPLNLECLKELARLEERSGEKRAARDLYDKLLAFDPGDAETARRARALDDVKGPRRGPAARRLLRPLLAASDEKPTRSSATLRVALFSGADARPAVLTRVVFMANAPFVVAPGVKGESREPWEALYRLEDGSVELRDAAGSLRHATRGTLRVGPPGLTGSVLLKDARFAGAAPPDAGDREVRGEVELIVSTAGFIVVNEVALEDYVSGVTGAGLPQGSPTEAYKALAVVARTRALWHRERRDAAPGAFDLCDSRACQSYPGLSEEMRDATLAAAQTQAAVLEEDGGTADLRDHEDCGGRTEDGASAGRARLASVSDAAPALPPPADAPHLERWTHGFPPEGAYCAASALVPPAQARWMRVLSAGDVEARARRIKDIGALLSLHPAARTPTGRLSALEAVGSKGVLRVEGDEAIASLLSPGSLRSTWLTLQPLGGARPERFIVWGAGTGHGLGLCKAGALGRAAAGSSWEEILAAYFPGHKLRRSGAPRPK